MIITYSPCKIFCKQKMKFMAFKALQKMREDILNKDTKLGKSTAVTS